MPIFAGTTSRGSDVRACTAASLRQLGQKASNALGKYRKQRMSGKGRKANRTITSKLTHVNMGQSVDTIFAAIEAYRQSLYAAEVQLVWKEVRRTHPKVAAASANTRKASASWCAHSLPAAGACGLASQLLTLAPVLAPAFVAELMGGRRISSVFFWSVFAAVAMTARAPAPSVFAASLARVHRFVLRVCDASHAHVRRRLPSDWIIRQLRGHAIHSGLDLVLASLDGLDISVCVESVLLLDYTSRSTDPSDRGAPPLGVVTPESAVLLLEASPHSDLSSASRVRFGHEIFGNAGARLFDVFDSFSADEFIESASVYGVLLVGPTGSGLV
ncbi:hypothetical protein HDU83_008313 [Entophlyctis luteolus]|nr:hypothetical protein HDU83_008313 [Entophlyctis luteolus]